jgi:hypothetical protein
VRLRNSGQANSTSCRAAGALPVAGTSRCRGKPLDGAGAGFSASLAPLHSPPRAQFTIIRASPTTWHSPPLHLHPPCPSDARHWIELQCTPPPGPPPRVRRPTSSSHDPYTSAYTLWQQPAVLQRSELTRRGLRCCRHDCCVQARTKTVSHCYRTRKKFWPGCRRRWHLSSAHRPRSIPSSPRF